MVRAWIPAAFGCTENVGRRSSTNALTPARPSCRAETRPTGPAPTMMTSKVSTFLGVEDAIDTFLMLLLLVCHVHARQAGKSGWRRNFIDYRERGLMRKRAEIRNCCPQ